MRRRRHHEIQHHAGPLLIVTVVAFVGAREGGVFIAPAQGDNPPAPADLVAANGPNSGEVNLTWPATPGVSSYRVGWLADEDYQAYPDK
jgi:hypothetical protein